MQKCRNSNSWMHFRELYKNTQLLQVSIEIGRMQLNLSSFKVYVVNMQKSANSNSSANVRERYKTTQLLQVSVEIGRMKFNLSSFNVYVVYMQKCANSNSSVNVRELYKTTHLSSRRIKSYLGSRDSASCVYKSSSPIKERAWNTCYVCSMCRKKRQR